MIKGSERENVLARMGAARGAVGAVGPGLGGCWVWQGAMDADGYGVIRVGSVTDGSRRNLRVHRVAWELRHKEDLAGRKVVHTCGVSSWRRRCFNPEHLDVEAGRRATFAPHNVKL